VAGVYIALAVGFPWLLGGFLFLMLTLVAATAPSPAPWPTVVGLLDIDLAWLAVTVFAVLRLVRRRRS